MGERGRKAGPDRLTSALCLGTLLNPLNSSMIAVALVTLRDEFALDLASVIWIVTAFYLTSATAQPLMGRFADRFGPKRMFVFGMALVSVTCALAPFSPSFTWLCVARVVMAVGTATAFPSAVVMISARSALDGSASVRRLALIQMAGTAGAAVGPVVGGFLVTVWGWPALFYVNIPLALAAIWGISGAPADARGTHGQWRQTWRDSDPVGIFSFIAAMVLLISAGLDALPASPWAVAAAGVGAAVFFLRHELGTRKPFLDVRKLGQNRSLLVIYICLILFNAIFYSIFFGLPQLLEESAGYSPQTVGLLMFPLTAVSIFATPPAARAIERWGVRPVMMTGLGALVGTCAALSVLTSSTAIPLVLAVTAMMGIPYAVSSIAASQGMYASAAAEDRGVASGIFQTFRYLGSISATIMIGALYQSTANAHDWGRLVIVMLILGFVALGLSLLWRPAPASER